MKMQRFCFLYSITLVITFFVSCTQSTTSQVPTSPPSAVLIHTVTPTSTLTQIPTSALTVIPTLSVELAQARLLDLLENNNNCHLPCLWGITPGISIYQDIQNILIPLVSIGSPVIMNLFSSPIRIDPSYIEGDSKIDAFLRFSYGNDGIVSRILFQVGEFKRVVTPSGESVYEKVFNSEAFGERVRPYMLPQVLTEQGTPAAVLLQTSGTLVKDSGGFRILLFYPDQGLLIYYETQMKIIGDKVQGCFANAHVEMELYPSGHPESFSEYIALTDWANLWPPPTNNAFWQPIEKATTMSLEQFYEKFRQPNDNCIETPANIWPTP